MVEHVSRNHQSTAQPADQMMLILEIPLPFLPQKESLAPLALERKEIEEAQGSMLHVSSFDYPLSFCCPFSAAVGLP